MNKAKHDFKAFVQEWNVSQNLNTPDLHEEICIWLADAWGENNKALLLMAFRNSGKSTLVGLFAAWLLLTKPNTRILVLAADHALARKMVRNVKRIIERHDRTQHLKPKKADQWASDQFTVVRGQEQRDPSMLAKGIGSNVTGLRADIIICDDVEVPNTCDTEPKRIDLRERLSEIDYVLVPGGTQLYVGTPHTYFSIYANETRPEADEEVPFLNSFKRLELPILNEHGNSRWPDRFPEAEIDKIRERSGANKFRSQMMLHPVNIADGRLNPDHLRPYDDALQYHERNGNVSLELGGRRLTHASCWWDPSYGSTEKGDGSVIACVFNDEAGGRWLHDISYLTIDPTLAPEIDEATQQCRQVTSFLKRNYLPNVHLETNGIGKFLPGILRRELTQAGIQCAVVEKHSSEAKAHRIIKAFDVLLAAGGLHAQKSVLASSFIMEMREWHPKRKGPDDGLDAVAGCLINTPQIIPRQPQKPASEMRPRTNWQKGSGTFTAKTGFQI